MPAPQQRILVTGKITDTKDPDGLGRVQIELAGFDRSVSLPWVRLASIYASREFGAVFLPEVGDEVAVLQGSGNSVDQMVVLGGVYNGTTKPPYSNDDGDNDKKIIRTRSGHELVFNDHQGGEKITVQTPDGKLLVELDHAAGKVTVKSASEVLVTCPSGKVNVECSQASIQASSSVKVSGASKVDVSSGGKVTVSAPNISLAGNVDLG